MKKRVESIFPFHPFLFGLYPVLTLYYINIGEVVLPAIQLAVVTSALITILACFGFLLFTRSWERTAPLISFSILMFFTYGHIYNQMEGTTILEIVLGRHRFMLPIWGLILLIGILLLTRKHAGRRWAGALNSISVIMLGLTLAQIGFHFYQARVLLAQRKESEPHFQIASQPSGRRDVYYILLDAYSRQDLLQEVFDLDNTEFILEMEKLGFYIPRCGQSNYFNTYPSMSATLNMNYLDALGVNVSTADQSIYSPLIQKNAVVRIFQELGYQTITFKGLYPTIDIQDSTYYFDFFEESTATRGLASGNFQYLFLQTTGFRPLLDYLENREDLDLPPALAAWFPVNTANDSREYRHYQQTVFALNTLESLPALPGKKFVYAHLFITHQPFVFYPDGQFHSSLAQDFQAYRDQIIFTNTRILEIIKTLIGNSDPEPIIIIQSDHSYVPGPDRVKNFNAYRLPDGGNQSLYETITPVNSFRVVFNQYFGGEYQLLPDISVYAYVKIGDTRDIRIAPSTCVGESK